MRQTSANHNVAPDIGEEEATFGGSRGYVRHGTAQLSKSHKRASQTRAKIDYGGAVVRSTATARPPRALRAQARARLHGAQGRPTRPRGPLRTSITADSLVSSAFPGHQRHQPDGTA